MFKRSTLIALLAFAGYGFQALAAPDYQSISLTNEEATTADEGFTVFTGPLELTWGGFLIENDKFSDVQVGDYLNYFVSDYDGAMWIAHFGGVGQLEIGNDAGIHIYNPGSGVISYEIDSEKLEKLKSGGIYMNGVGFTVQKVTVTSSIEMPDTPEIPDGNFVWTGDEAITWGGAAFIDKAKFADVNVGDELCIVVSGYIPSSHDASWIAHFGGWAGLAIGSTHLDFTYSDSDSCIKFNLTDEMVAGLKNDGFFLNGDGFRVLAVGISGGNGTTGIGSVSVDTSDKSVDVYNLSGVLVRSNVAAGSATDGLAPGFYIIGGKKCIVR